MSHRNDNNAPAPRPGSSPSYGPSSQPPPDQAGAAPDPHAPRPDPSMRIAHELANLLDGSLRNLGLVLSDIQDPESVKGSPLREAERHLARLETTNQALKQMAALVRRWMGYATTPDDMLNQSLELGQTIDQAVRLLRPAALSRGIEVHVCLSEAASRLPAGPVYPVIANTLRNSIEAIADAQPHEPNGEGHGDRIELVAQIKAGRVELVVRDTGPGVDPDLLDEDGVFRFGRSTKPDHLGVGLSLCREVADTLGGHVELRNRSPRGAVFTLSYPVSRGGRDG